MRTLALDADVGRLLTAQLASGNPLFIVCHGAWPMLLAEVQKRVELAGAWYSTLTYALTGESPGLESRQASWK